jgi:GNAT superfamily N-acetyltransferase
MADFYAEAGYELERERAAGAFAPIIADERLGYVWIIQLGQNDVGHLVLTLKYAMEYGGLIACLDDLYVMPAWRNKGLSRAALLEVRRFCEKAGIRAITVEVSPHNGPAQHVYRRVGFTEPADRQLLALALAAPTHVL